MHDLTTVLTLAEVTAADLEHAARRLTEKVESLKPGSVFRQETDEPLNEAAWLLGRLEWITGDYLALAAAELRNLRAELQQQALSTEPKDD